MPAHASKRLAADRDLVNVGIYLKACHMKFEPGNGASIYFTPSHYRSYHILLAEKSMNGTFRVIDMERRRTGLVECLSASMRLISADCKCSASWLVIERSAFGKRSSSHHHPLLECFLFIKRFKKCTTSLLDTDESEVYMM